MIIKSLSSNIQNNDDNTFTPDTISIAKHNKITDIKSEKREWEIARDIGGAMEKRKILSKKMITHIFLELWKYMSFGFNYLLPHLLERCPHKIKHNNHKISEENRATIINAERTE